MKKVILIFLITIGLWAEASITEGLYISDECHISIKIENRLDISYYTLYEHSDSKEHELNITTEDKDTYLRFSALYKTYDNDGDGSSHSDINSGDKAGKATALLENDSAFSIQNYGNSMNPYMTFNGCAKFLHYKRIDSVSMLEKKLKTAKTIKKYSNGFIYAFRYQFAVTSHNVESYNNVAYYLQKKGGHKRALILLGDVLLSFPSRVVAHYNYAQSVEALLKEGDNSFNQKEIDRHYLSYIAQLLFDKKAHKIPKKLKTIYSSYYAILKDINKKISEKYQVLGVAKGDINNDAQQDISLVVELVKGSKIKTREKYSSRPSNTNKRIWLVYLAEKGQYTFFRKNKHLIKADEYTNCDDNFDDIKIEKNSLFLNTHYWCSMGSWSMGGADYQFIYRDKELILAGIESHSNHRGSGEGHTKSANYLTKRVKTQKTVDMGDAEGKANWEKLEIGNPIKFESYIGL